MILLLDNFDSFTYNLVDYIGRLGRACCVVRNDVPVTAIEFDSYSALLISPGPEIPATSGNLMEVLEKAAGTMPVLGICLGHQAIGEMYGGTLARAPKPMHGKVSEITVNPADILFAGLPPAFSVVRYNSLIVRNPGKDLIVTARSTQNEIMALSHVTLPVHGVQFHPEAILTAHGLDILGNWLDYYSIDS